jgi:hypothetical protein
MQTDDNKGEKMKVAKTAPDALKLLWKDKMLLKPKNVQEIDGELEKRGYNFDSKTLMMAPKNAKFLTRKGAERNYTYVQKHPYLEGNENGE